MKQLRPKKKVKCMGGDQVIRLIETDNIIHRGNGWVNYQCPKCDHVIMRISVEIEHTYYREKRRRVVYWWKCEDCGETYPKSSPGEPRRGCPTCGQRGVKTFVKEVKEKL